jgi:hypothetical protein
MAERLVTSCYVEIAPPSINLRWPKEEPDCRVGRYPTTAPGSPDSYRDRYFSCPPTGGSRCQEGMPAPYRRSGARAFAVQVAASWGIRVSWHDLSKWTIVCFGCKRFVNEQSAVSR